MGVAACGLIKRFVLGLGLLSGLWACSDRDWSLLGEREVRRILPRYAMLAAGIESRGEPDSIRQAAYRQFFASEGYSLRDWDSSMMWYAKNNIPLYYDFYRLASANIGKQADLLQQRVDSISRAEEYRRNRLGYVVDSVNLLNIPVAYYRSGDLVNTTFNIQPSTPYTNAEGVLSVAVSGLPKLKSEQAWHLELRFYTQDSIMQVENRAIPGSGRYEVKLATQADKSVVRIAGHLRGITPKLKKGRFIWVDSLRFIRVPHAEEQTEAIPKDEETTSEPEPNATEEIELL